MKLYASLREEDLTSVLTVVAYAPFGVRLLHKQFSDIIKVAYLSKSSICNYGSSKHKDSL